MLAIDLQERREAHATKLDGRVLRSIGPDGIEPVAGKLTENDELTGLRVQPVAPLLARGVHLAPWKSSLKGHTTFLVVTSGGTLVGDHPRVVPDGVREAALEFAWQNLDTVDPVK